MLMLVWLVPATHFHKLFYGPKLVGHSNFTDIRGNLVGCGRMVVVVEANLAATKPACRTLSRPFVLLFADKKSCATKCKSWCVCAAANALTLF